MGVAAEGGSEEIVGLLLNAGLDVNTVNKVSISFLCNNKVL